MTEIVDIPETLPLNPFPHVDAPEESYNADAYEVGLQLPPAIERVREIAEAGRLNSIVAKDGAAAAAVAVPAAARAEAARDRAVQAEQAIDQALADGPVLSVQGKTGIVDITEELHAAALYF